MVPSAAFFFIPHAGVSWLEKDCERGSAHITVECTCKLPVTIATVTELCDQLAVDLKDEDAAGLVVDHDDVTVPVHRHAFRAHQLPRANLALKESKASC